MAMSVTVEKALMMSTIIPIVTNNCALVTPLTARTSVAHEKLLCRTRILEGDIRHRSATVSFQAYLMELRRVRVLFQNFAEICCEVVTIVGILASLASLALVVIFSRRTPFIFLQMTSE